MIETVADRSARLGRANGFDGMRLLLAIGIVFFHSYTLTTGGVAGMAWLCQLLARMILPAFFVLSGYLVMASLSRSGSVGEFLFLRLMRIMPALSVVIVVTVLVLGPLLTVLPLRGYFSDPAAPTYFQNLLGQPRFALPGVFEDNPRPGIVNGSLWTIQMEIGCYVLLGMLGLLVRHWLFNAILLVLAIMLFFPRMPFVGLLLVWLPAKELVLGFVTGALFCRAAHFIPLHAAAGTLSLALAFWLSRDPANGALTVLPLAYGVIWVGLRHVPAVPRADYSYGLYLTAYPLEQLFLNLLPMERLWWADFIFALPLGLLSAALLWHGLEKPLLVRKHEILNLLARATQAVRA